MLSRQILGEILTANESGTIGPGGGSRKRRKGDCASKGRWPSGLDSGAVEGGKRARLLCQKDALAWLRDSSSPRGDANVRRAFPDGTAAPYGRCAGGGDVIKQARSWIRASTDEKDDPCGASVLFGSPKAENRRRRHPAVKLYDHDHNPRILRALVDDTIATGTAGGGVLKAEAEQRLKDLRQELRLAYHRTIELEDQMFQSQTGMRPHRELLGELHLGQAPTKIVTILKTARENDCADILNQRPHLGPLALQIQRAGLTETAGKTSRSCHGRNPSTGGKYTRCPSAARRARHGGSPARSDTNDLSTANRREGIRYDHSGFEAAHRSKLIATCNPPLSPRATPTASLRRYLSSLRPFSADSARAAWGMAETSSDFTLAQATNSSWLCEPRWPVLFSIGGETPPARHPLGVYGVPVFDDKLLKLLATASGEPLEEICAMARALSRCDFQSFQTSLKRICCAHTMREDGEASGRGETIRAGAPRCRIQAWVSTKEEILIARAPPAVAGAAGVGKAVSKSTALDGGGQGEIDDPVILSDAVATRALTGGILHGVFGECTIQGILQASRPVVVFDSANTEDIKPISSTLAEDVKFEDESSLWKEIVKDDNSTFSQKRIEAGTEESESSATMRAEEPITAAIFDDIEATSPPHSVPHSHTCQRQRSGGPNGLAATTHASAIAGSSSRDVSLLNLNSSVQLRGATTLGHQPPVTAPSSEGVLVAQLIHAAAARLRVYSVAVRHRSLHGDTESSRFTSCTSRRDLYYDQQFVDGLFIGGSGNRRAAKNEGRPQIRRSASADSDERGLPPLKLLKRAKRDGRSRRTPWGQKIGKVAYSKPATKSNDHGEGDDGEGVFQEAPGGQARHIAVDRLETVRPRSTPRCLRPGFQVNNPIRDSGVDLFFFKK